MRKSVLLLAIMLAPMMLGQGGFLPDGPITLQARPSAVPPSLFGMIPIKLNWGASWPPFSFYGAMVWVYWGTIEPQPGAVDFTRVDVGVAAANKNHTAVILVLGGTPAWALCNPQGAAKDNLAMASRAPCDLNAWRDYVRSVVRHYKNSGIEGYEPWNEPNNYPADASYIAPLLEMNRIAYEVIKKEQPSALVLTSGINATETSWDYLENYARAGGLKYADILAEHFYVPPAPPEAMLRKIRKVQQIVQRYRPGMPIWNTETGWRIPNHDRIVDDASAEPWAGKYITDKESVAYVGRSYLLTWAAGVDRLYWYSWGHPSMGLNEYDMKTPKPAAHAFEAIQKWMIGQRVTSCERSAQKVWTCKLEQGSDRTLIAWSEDGDVQFAVPAKFNVAEELAGPRESIPGRYFRLGIVPVRFSEK
ncbi:MAG: hypothetical protein ABSD44_03680 [Terracidiphilus sp.]